MEIGCITISHKNAKVEEIEKIWLTVKPRLEDVISKCSFSEYAYIFTCNRFEIYLVGENLKSCLQDIAEELGITGKAEIFVGESCLRHLLRVASGIESMIVGEEQILGQVRQCFNLCREGGQAGEVLERVFGKAVQVGRRVRRETAISKGSVSIGSAAVEVAERVLGTLKGKKALLVGAGEMGTLVAKAIAGKEVEAVLIANRTYEKAEELAKRIGGVAVKFDKLVDYLKVCDVVISATSAPHAVITRGDVERAMRERSQKLLIIDIALPRDVDESVAQLDGVELLTIDDLRRISEENLARRREEIAKVEGIIEEELEQLKLLLKDISARDAIAAMYSLAERFVGEEVEELYAKLNARYGVSEDVKEILNDFANSLIKKFLREPTVRLREAARKDEFHVIESIKYVFGDGNGRVSEGKDAKVEEGKPEVDVQRSKAES
ncbi:MULTISPECIES: glutamyl-tRNA reductase [Archaeoglobus]|jgi:glutamyl-tRNA reductase|uniref:Glutamyl-tRNA reductase n=3 Tax=Archaeoglobus fulgidus TaxID=2234 RepID=HEM1_ARCFU|nr:MULTISPECIES: glutamyl-tRNA reductase [Archaeoglobus]O28304.1 RecName: Full=Glutamyl-tRNA reductase; Short=GluTR [Archaeoglobus fulgidus DSM 4304]AAB89281.1 glutamyl-tRNA reductase (hemA) [Archaeoglobus fulgidus DSM 4304]AIG98966.1 glutamyl-tRNA reductase [Archaeoglobus fulgidus DSM 8774]KUJ93806.1 MAG: Glutamyl-tRNA reductase [Archaeoglobus fulgidus]KUK06498.1 MAG: Glutamyl-tRNA reductase [Archaeoglobus fulgidus]MDI3497795.1 glutamyl-tRNA reductase [Archaeoglobus sp.]